jgi:putative phage-type endonuclease
MPLTEEQVSGRKNYIGGSDAASVLGLSRWKSPLEVWAQKTGLVEPEDISGQLQIRLGNRLESAVVELFEEETGKKAHRVNETIIHKKYPYICANIDRRIVGEKAILEAKTASAWKAKEWQDEDMPVEYILQCVHYLAVTGAEKAYLAVLIGNEKFVWKEILRDEKMISDLIKKEVEFWESYVVPKVMPQIIKHTDDDILYKLFPRQVDEKQISFTDDQMRLVESIQSLNQDMAAIERQIDRHKNELKAIMKDAEIAKFGDNKIIATWKEQKSIVLDMPSFKAAQPEMYHAFELEKWTRVFRIKNQ